MNQIIKFLKNLFKTKPIKPVGVLLTNHEWYNICKTLKSIIKEYSNLIDSGSNGIICLRDIDHHLRCGICCAVGHYNDELRIEDKHRLEIEAILEYHNIHTGVYMCPTLVSRKEPNETVTLDDIGTCIIPRITLLRNIVANLEQLKPRIDGLYLYEI